MKDQEVPSIDRWLAEAKKDKNAEKCGMFLFHNGLVRKTAKAEVRDQARDLQPVTAMIFDYDEEKVAQALAETQTMPGVYYVRLWLNRGHLAVGDDIMMVLIGGDIRPRVIDALEFLVGHLKDHCVKEEEVFEGI